MSSTLFPAATENHRAPQEHLGTLSGIHSPTLESSACPQESKPAICSASWRPAFLDIPACTDSNFSVCLALP